jgi:hypothetical protein
MFRADRTPAAMSFSPGGRSMKKYGIVVLFVVLSAVVAATALAADFAWLQDLNIQAQADPSGFKASLATRFKIGGAEVSAVLSNVQQPADAYMVLRLGEMSGQPVKTVETHYRAEKGKGWGVLAKSLGIKPGSPEFHALKRGHDLGEFGGGAGPGNGKGRGKGHGHGHDRS